MARSFSPVFVGVAEFECFESVEILKDGSPEKWAASSRLENTFTEVWVVHIDVKRLFCLKKSELHFFFFFQFGEEGEKIFEINLTKHVFTFIGCKKIIDDY